MPTYAQKRRGVYTSAAGGGGLAYGLVTAKRVFQASMRNPDYAEAMRAALAKHPKGGGDRKRAGKRFLRAHKIQRGVLFGGLAAGAGYGLAKVTER